MGDKEKMNFWRSARSAYALQRDSAAVAVTEESAAAAAASSSKAASYSIDGVVYTDHAINDCELCVCKCVCSSSLIAQLIVVVSRLTSR